MTRALRTLTQTVRADYLERVRRHGFLVTLCLTLYAAYAFLPPADSKVATLQIAGHRGVYNSAWVGCTVAMLAATFLSLAGFYLVKNAVERDRRTGVGQILASTMISKPLYTLGKAGSNFAVLATMTLLLGCAAIGMQWLRGEERSVDLIAIFAPFVIVTLPAVAVVAALAVLFESIRWLRGGLGNVVYFFLFCGGVGSASQLDHRAGGLPDFLGVTAIVPAMKRAVAAAFPGVDTGSMSMGFSIRQESWHLSTFVWDGPEWTAQVWLARLGWVLVAVAIALLAAIPFDRFDTAASSVPGTRRKASKRPAPSAAASEEGAVASAAPAAATGAAPAPRELAVAARGRFTLPTLLWAEMLLMVRGMPRAWWLIAAGLAVACWFTPLSVARGWLLPFAWIWPVLAWSPMGAREKLDRTEGLVFSSPRPLTRQLAASWCAGLVLALALGAGVIVRLAAAGTMSAAMATLAGAVFIPSFALACGAWSGNGRLFEVLYLLLWYMGPMNHTPPLDYIGTTDATLAAGAPARFAIITAALLALAVFGRSRRLRGS